jgi:hypothetical protein
MQKWSRSPPVRVVFGRPEVPFGHRAQASFRPCQRPKGPLYRLRPLLFIGDLAQNYVHWSLLYERDRSGNDAYQANDFKDAPFLAQAIAYGNIVVTEKRWTQHAKNTGIAKHYGTTVLKSLRDLPDALAKEGCL